MEQRVAKSAAVDAAPACSLSSDDLQHRGGGALQSEPDGDASSGGSDLPESPGNVVCLVDSRARIVAAHATLCRRLGQPGQGRDAPKSLSDLIDAPDMDRRLEQLYREKADLTFPARLAGALASAGPVEVSMQLLRGPSESFALVEVRRPVTESPARLDPLTKLPDRDAIAQRIDQWRREASPGQAHFAVLFLDLDDFKRVNDDYGHAVGDAVLRTLAGRWLECLREGDLVARYGGDEFVVLLHGVATAEDAEPVQRRLEAATAAPIQLEERQVVVTATIGLAMSSSDDISADELIEAADREMYARKRAARE